MDSVEISTKAGSILVVEDDHIDTLVVKALLEKHFDLQIVTSGEDAIEALKDKSFDIVLADINLGNQGMDGVKLMKTIREDKNHDLMKVFAVTSYYENRNFFLEQGFDELLTKPVIREEILDILNNTIKNNSQITDTL